MKKPLVIAGAVVAAGLSGLVGAHVVSAASDPTARQTLADQIASTFHLNKADVQKVIDQNREQREAERQQKFKDNVAQAVKDGKMTQSLADQLLAKVADLESYRDSLKDKTPTERRDAMKTKVQEFRTWAKDNKVPQQFWHVMREMGPE